MGSDRTWQYVKERGNPPQDGLYEIAFVVFAPDAELKVYADRFTVDNGWFYFTDNRLLSVNGQIYAWRVWETSVDPPPCDITFDDLLC